MCNRCVRNISDRTQRHVPPRHRQELRTVPHRRCCMPSVCLRTGGRRQRSTGCSKRSGQQCRCRNGPGSCCRCGYWQCLRRYGCRSSDWCRQRAAHRERSRFRLCVELVLREPETLRQCIHTVHVCEREPGTRVRPVHRADDSVSLPVGFTASCRLSSSTGTTEVLRGLIRPSSFIAAEIRRARA